MSEENKIIEQLASELKELRLRMADMELDTKRLKQAEAALTESEHRFKHLYEQAPIGYQSLDENGNFIEVNNAWLEAFGYTKEEVIGRSFADFLHPDRAEHFEENFSRFKAVGEVLGVEFEMVKKNGSTMLLSFDGKIGRDPHGRFKQTHCVFHDITERKRVEEALRARENLLESVFRAAPTGIGMVSNRVLLAVNDRVCEMIGRTQEELIGKSARILYSSDADFEYVGTEKYRQIGERGTGTVETRWQCKDGRIIDVLLSSTPITPMDMAGVVTFTALDITEKKRAEAQLFRSEERLRLALKAANQGLYDLNVRTGEAQVSPEYATMLGYDPSGFHETNAAWIERLHPEDHEPVAAIYRDYIAGKIPEYKVEFRQRTKSGDWKWILSLGKIVEWDARKEPLRMLGTHTDITERKQAEEALREATSRIENTLESISDAFFSMDDNLVVTYFNAAAERLLNRKGTEVTGKYLFDAFPEARGSIFDEKYHQAVAEKAFLTFECYFDVAPYRNWYDVRVYPREEGISVYFQVITERKFAEAAAQAEKEKYRLLVRQVPGIVFKGYADYSLDCFDDKIEALTGYTQGEFKSRAVKWNDVVLEEYIAPLKKQLKKALKSDGFYVSEFRIRRKSGEVVWVQARNQLVKNAQGRMDYVSGVFFDINERKLAEEALRESEKRYRYLFDHNPHPMWLYDKKTLDFLEVNDVAVKHYGYSRAEFLAMTILDIHEPEAAPRIREVIEHLRGDIRRPGIYRQRKKDGTFIDVDLTTYDLEFGHRPARLVLADDVTERRRAEKEKDALQAQLVQARKMESVGRLAGGVAHDFNNMLSAILGHAELAILLCTPSEPIHAHLKEIENSALRSADLIRQLLTFARRQTVAPKILDLNESVTAMLKMLLRLIGEDIDLVWAPKAGLWSVKIDPSQVDQLLANLCINARDAIAEVGKVTIETENAIFDDAYCAIHPGFIRGEYVMLAVSDDGCGMDKDVFDQLFEPFFTTKEVGKGTGLGLATVYGIVKQNEGFINVYSEPGKGSTFKVYLPRFAVEAAEPIDAKTAQTPKGHGEMVLLVEDEAVILDLCRTMLENLGYTVLTAGTPGEALRQAIAHYGEIKLLITDVVMPEMNGRDLAKLISDIEPGLKCLFISGYTANVIAHRGVLDEGVHFLQKPFSTNDLATKVREVLERE